MNKTKFFSSLLVGTMFLASASVVTSCKDYDDDIKNLQTQVDALSAIKASFDKGVIITDITNDGSGVVIKTSDGKTWTVSNGTNGKDADVWTIGNDGYWYKNNVNSGISATGEAGAAGATGATGNYWYPEADGYFYEYASNGTRIGTQGVKWAQNGGAGISAIKTNKGVLFLGVAGYPDGVFIPTIASLTSLVFIPQTYYWGIEAAKVTRFTPKWYLANGEKDGNITGNWLDLKQADANGESSYIDNDEQRKEIIGTKRTVPNPENLVNYEDIDVDMNVHERYNMSNSVLTIMLDATAQYHWNPTVAYWDNETAANIISDNKSFTRGMGNATVSLLGDSKFGNNDKLFVQDGILNVPLKVDGTVGTIATTTVNPATGAESTSFDQNPGVTTFATQITYKNGVKDTTVTSDYAAIIEETVKDLRLSHVVKKTAGFTVLDDEYYIQTKLFNTHCGKCTLAESNNHGMHLFATVGEAKYFVANTNRINDNVQGEGQDLVQYNEDIDLTALVETHYTNESGNHAKFSDADFNGNFKYVFELTDFRYDDRTATNESAHAALYIGSDGHYYLHPQDPQEGGLQGKPYSSAKASEVVVNRIPLVRVSLVYVANGHNDVIDYGYLPIRIVKEKVQPKHEFITVTYTSTEDATVTRYNDCFNPAGANVEAYSTNWRQTEEDLMSHQWFLQSPDFGRALTHEEFREVYTAQYTLSGTLADLDQYYQSGAAYNLEDNTAPIDLNKIAIGRIAYDDRMVAPGATTNTLIWTIDAAEIQMLANAGITNVTRAILLKSNNIQYPDIYVVFNSGKISLENKTVTANMHLDEKIIAEYWYESGQFTNGKAEIHTNVVTPEENSGTGNTGAAAWKPVNFENVFRNVFLKNFNGNTPADWITFTGAPTANGGYPFVATGMKFDIVFDESNINRQFYGYTDAGAPKVFKMALSNNHKVLKATIDGINYQDVAEIVGTWNGTTADYLNLQNMKIELKKTEYAKALLNYVDHLEIGQPNVLNATVAIIPTTLVGTNPQDMDGDLIKSAIRYTVAGNQTVSYCPIKVENYKFDVRFLRPISIDKTEDTTIEDATSSTDRAQVIKLSELVNGFTDFRGTTVAMNWKQSRDNRKPYWNANLDYETYYSPDGTNDFVITVQGFTPIASFLGHFLSENDNVLTNLNKQNRTAANEWVKLKDVSALIDFKITGNDEITYLNNSATVQEFQVKIPVAIEYYWGTIYDHVTITVKKTQGNAREFK